MADNDQTTTQNEASASQRATLPQDVSLAPPAQDAESNPTASQHENDISVQTQQVNAQAPQVIVSPVRANTSVVVASPVQTETVTEQITADGNKEYPLQHEPTKITSVTVNGQSTAGDTSSTGVTYNVEKNALVFANEVRGLIEVVYAHAPEVAQGAITKAVASLHDRVVRIESFVARWEKANL